MRGRIPEQLAFRRDPGADALHARAERGLGLDRGRRSPMTLAARGEDHVVALAPDRHRRAAHDVVRPREPGDEQRERCRSRRARPAEARGGPPTCEQRTDHRERDHEDEDRTHQRDPGGDRAERGPINEAALLPRPGEEVGARQHAEAGERLAQHERHVVLRPRIDGVQDAGEERDAVAPPATDRQHQEPRAEPEQHALPEQHGQMVALEDRALSEEREVEGVAGRAKDLALERLPRRPRDPCAGDVVPALAEDEVEARHERRRVRAIADRVRRREIRPAVGLVVRADERDVREAVEPCGHRDDRHEETRTAGESAVHSH
jgi:hypothetical protein